MIDALLPTGPNRATIQKHMAYGTIRITVVQLGTFSSISVLNSCSRKPAGLSHKRRKGTFCRTKIANFEKIKKKIFLQIGATVRDKSTHMMAPRYGSNRLITSQLFGLKMRKVPYQSKPFYGHVKRCNGTKES